MTIVRERIADLRQRIEAALTDRLPPTRNQAEPLAPTLSEAMRYSALAGGKRLRPLLCCAAAEASGGDPDSAIAAGCAIEFVHTYSLIHDDLPAMDDDALRRGKPTCHIKFGEAQAILAGDALQALAFELLADQPGPANSTLRMIKLLGQAAGWQGMVGGQSLDLALTGNGAIEQPKLEALHAAKTGALLRTSLELGNLSVDPFDEAAFSACSSIGDSLGLAFQVIDDVLDVSETTQVLGKDAGSDAQQGKATFVDLLGEQGARDYASRLFDQAVAKLPQLPGDCELLSAVAEKVVFRDR